MNDEFRIAIVLAFLLTISTAAVAQIRPDLLAVDSAFVNGQYEQTELLALRILQTDTTLTPDVKARLNLTCGYALIMLGREPEARVYFDHALDAVPDLVLDPIQVSPKFRVVFDEVKAGHPASRDRFGRDRGGNMIITNIPGRNSPLTIFRRAMLTNLILPGSGQWQEGRKLRGAVFFGAQVVTVAFLLTEISTMRDSRADYLAESNPARIADAYDKYNRDYHWTVAAGIVTGVVYLASQTDLVLMKPHGFPHTALGFSPDGPELTLRW